MNLALRTKKMPTPAERDRCKMKVLKSMFQFILMLFGVKSDTCKKAVDDDICDYSGQGRDKYGD